ncbi:enoyl-CoA hydratase [Capronia epimyces CBS 606.96]|uniref:Enoyl-CoA hydratase n=1 Tax=Capronia epimyces CBS 606.96 TaxID=1182542 RepID=W9YQT9_9EURO|nr:enoyl-CoA hydratase [Capronia epimyces CBS 606.96]EXJ92030.1 enoyl-CoA hydratase [Capronia epimyces CBS 606.96]
MPREPRPPLKVPESYSSLPLEHVKVSNVPASSPTVTPVILVTLNRPQKHNAFTDLMRENLERVYELVDIDPRVKVVVLTGAGRSFCAGADLEIGFLGAKDENGHIRRPKTERDVDHRDGGGRVSLAIHHCSKPTIAAIQGAAVGVGITMSLPACIRVAYAKAKVGFVFSRRGIIMEACSSYFLPRLIGHSRALHLTTTGSVYPADHPLFGSLFSETCSSPEATLTRALELADEIAKNTSTVSTKLMRELMYRGPDSAEGTHLLDSRILHGLFGSKDNLEGVESFLQKRPVNFTGQVPQDTPDWYPWWQQVDIGEKEGDIRERESKL